MLSLCVLLNLQYNRNVISESVENCLLSQTACSENCNEANFDEDAADTSSTSLIQKYVSKEFVSKGDINLQEVSQVLKQIRISNVNRVIIGHLNVNFFAVKLDAIKTIIPGNVDIVIFGETKLDASYPTAQLMIDGFKTPLRKD